MATTSNYGWTIPDDTDLVKNGALAIRTLGNAIDTTAASTFVGGLQHLNTTTFSGVASQSINDVFSATYDNYLIITNVLASSDTSYELRLRVSGADNTTSNYNSIQLAGVAGTPSSATSSSQTSFNRFGNVSANEISTVGYIFNPFVAKNTIFQNDINSFISAGLQIKKTSGYFNGTTSFTGFTLLTPGQTFSGSIKVYGVKQ